jgi:hypothetical protein
MATSLKTGVNATTDNGTKKYLDFTGLNALWDNICDKFAPQWKSVNFDFIAASEPTHEASTVVIPFQNLSLQPNSEGVVDHTNVLQTTYTIKAATQSAAGVLTAADKKKIDELGETTENAVTIKTISVGDSATDKTPLTITTDKDVAFGLAYDANTDTLSIMDLNAATPVALSSVHVLGDALANALIDDVKLVTTDDKGNTGTFIEITFSVVKHNDDHTETTDTKKIYLDVDDLISVYTPGDGIDIAQTSTGLDGTTTTTTISLVAPKRVSNNNKIGGIIPNKIYTGAVTNWKNTSGTTAPAMQDLGTQSGRYFGIETDKDGRAFVNVPSAEAAIGTSTNGADTINNTGANDTFTAVTDVEFTLSEDGKTYTVVPKKTVFTVSKETELSKATDSAVASKSDVVLNGSTAQSFETISDITVNDHEVKLSKVTHTIKETELSFEKGTDDGVFDDATININLIPGETTAVTAPVVTNVDKGSSHHAVEVTGKKLSFTVADPASIDIDYIEGLQWVVPITKQHFPNETVE